MKTRQGAELYAEQVLTNIEDNLTQLQQVVKNGQVYAVFDSGCFLGL